MTKRGSKKWIRSGKWWGAGLLVLCLLIPETAHLDEARYIYDDLGRLADEGWAALRDALDPEHRVR